MRVGRTKLAPPPSDRPYLLYAAVRPALRPLLSLGIARYFYIRDPGEIPDVMAREYAWHCSAVAGKES